MTLMEVMVAMAIAGVTIGGIVSGYIFCTAAAERAALTLAASSRASERLEETRSAKWDISGWPPVDELVSTNFPEKEVTLDMSGDRSVLLNATLRTYITQISVDPPLKSIRVDCIWKFKGSLTTTNSIETCRAPDQ